MGPVTGQPQGPQSPPGARPPATEPSGPGARGQVGPPRTTPSPTQLLTEPSEPRGRTAANTAASASGSLWPLALALAPLIAQLVVAHANPLLSPLC
jgi:hypothetical protein